MFNNRMLAVAAVLVMAVPALGAATPIVVPPVPEQLVEGHTVFTVIEIVRATATTESRFAAAVAVLVREYQANRVAQRFPGVLWFNDQYLVNPTQSTSAGEFFRYPCGGAVIAVNAGDPDPRIVIARVDVGNDGTSPTTVEGTTIDPTTVPGADADGDGVEDVPSTTVPGNTVPDTTVPGSGPTSAPVVGTTPESRQSVGPSNATYRADDSGYWVKPRADKNGDGVVNDEDTNGDGQPDDTRYYYGEDSGGPGDAPTDYAWVGAKAGTGDDQVYSDTVVGTLGGDLDWNTLNESAPWDYRESYLITDPNDHSWVIDKYNFYTRDGTSDTQNLDNEIIKEDLGDADDDAADAPWDDANGNGIVDAGERRSEHFPAALGGNLTTEYAYPVWVVNVLGSPVFVPDFGNTVGVLGERIGENCMPFKDLLEETLEPVNGATCGLAVDNGNLMGTGADSDLGLSVGDDGVAPWTDDPCMGYMEPSRNGYCYGGQDAADVQPAPAGDGDVDKADCLAERANKPLRMYNALLYFKLQDLHVFGADRDHSDPFTSTDTNGCSEEQYWWGPNPPLAASQWPCPGGDDDAEGNSHPFHPSAPVHEEREGCLPQFGGPNPTNHGGSSATSYTNPDGSPAGIQPGDRTNDAGWYEKWTQCDYAHGTRDIDIYFSPGGRPFPPVVRVFDVVDLEGSSAPFQDFHSAYPTQSP